MATSDLERALALKETNVSEAVEILGGLGKSVEIYTTLLC